MSYIIEDYLKNIYLLNGEDEPISTSSIAGKLSITSASVTNMLQKLASADPPLVDYIKHQGVRLTEAGRMKALRIIRRHRLMEQFLIQFLDYEWDEVHEEAEQLEHAMSTRLEQKISEALGNPEFGTHGGPIPRFNLSMPKNTSIPLKSLDEDIDASVLYIESEDVDIHQYLNHLNINPGCRIKILKKNKIDGTVEILLPESGQKQTIGSILAKVIRVNK